MVRLSCLICSTVSSVFSATSTMLSRGPGRSARSPAIAVSRPAAPASAICSTLSPRSASHSSSARRSAAFGASGSYSPGLRGRISLGCPVLPPDASARS